MLESAEVGKAGLTESNLSLYANFFVQQAIGSASSETASFALKALNLFKDQIFLDLSDHSEEKKHIYLEKGNTKLIFDMKSAFGIQQVAGDITKSVIVPIDSQGTEIDVLTESQLKANQLGVEFQKHLSKMKPGTYALKVVFETVGKKTHPEVTKAFRVYKSKAGDIDVDFLEQSNNYAVIEVQNVGEDYLVFLTLQKGKQLPYQVMGAWDKKEKKHFIKVNFT